MDINGTDLVAIIAACKDAGVTSFHKGDLAIEFTRHESPRVEYLPIALTSVHDIEDKHVPMTLDQMREQAEIENANLLFEDPAEFEKLMMEGEGN